MTLLMTTEAGYKTTGEDKHPAIDDISIFICRRNQQNVGCTSSSRGLNGFFKKKSTPAKSRDGFSAFMPVSLKCQKRAKFPGVDFLGAALKFRKRKKNLSLLVYVLHKKHEIIHFHVTVVQRQQRNVQKKCAARAYFLFCLINLLLF